MVKHIFTTVLLSLLVLFTLPACAADTLADAGITVSPELQAMGIDPGEYHPVAGEVWHAKAMPNPQITLGQLPSVYVLGDSIIAGLGPLGPGIKNLGIPGHQTGQMWDELARIPTGTARVVYIEGGINDYVHGSPANIVSNYRALISSVSPAAQARVIGILPVNEQQMPAAEAAKVSNAQILATDAKIYAICTGRCSVIPSPFGKSLPANMTDGGVHLNAVGNAALSAVIKH